MASVAKKLREDVTCSRCLQLMTDPVVIDCGHSFCRACITGITETPKRERPTDEPHVCPLCAHAFQRESLRPNQQLQSLIATIKSMNDDKLCEEHGEQLHLFCEDDDKLICLCCERKPQHKGHTSVLVEDVFQDYKEKLQDAVVKLREDLLQCDNMRLFLRKQKAEWKEKVKIQREKINFDFLTLRSFLQQEQEHFLRTLEKEERLTLRRLREEEGKVERQRRDLQSLILDVDNKCQDTIQNLMEGVKFTLIRSFGVKPEKPEAISLDVQTVCNVSELYCDVRNVVKRYQVGVTLDPETAHHDLLLSEDGRKVTGGFPQSKPPSPRRFTVSPCVLGCEGFSSGRSYFEVYVEEGSQFCALGVCLASVKRDSYVTLMPKYGFWAISQSREQGRQAHGWSPPPADQEQLSVVGVFVDYEAGLVSFYNVHTGSHIFTFPKASFSDPLLPFFLVFPSSSLTTNAPDMEGRKEASAVDYPQ